VQTGSIGQSIKMLIVLFKDRMKVVSRLKSESLFLLQAYKIWFRCFD